MRLDPSQQQRILPLKAAIVEHFDNERWLELGLLTGCLNEVRSHPRLLRSLGFGDDDYPGHVLDMLVTMATQDPGNIDVIERYLLDNGDGVTISTTDGRKRVYFTPTAFDVPDEAADETLVAVMMPFDAGFSGVHRAIQQACGDAGLRSERVDNLWQHSTVIQDIFSLIWRASIVVCDFTGRNANVFYECGIAHTLGKHVVPITQSKGDVPFDVQHHRFLEYLNNAEGLASLRANLASRLRTLAGTGYTFTMS